MKNFKSLFVIALVGISAFAIGQTKQKNTTEVFEYVSAEYDAVSEGTVIDCKNSKGEIKQFQYSKQDQTKNEEILFSKPIDLTIPAGKNVTKKELVGKKFSLTYISIGNDPANSKCCFKIINVTSADGLVPSEK